MAVAWTVSDWRGRVIDRDTMSTSAPATSIVTSARPLYQRWRASAAALRSSARCSMVSPSASRRSG